MRYRLQTYRTITLTTAFVLLLGVTPKTVQPAITFTQIDVPGGFDTRARGINSRGDIVGLFDDATGGTHGFLRSKDGTFTQIDVPGGSDIRARGINSRGDIVGRFTDGSGDHGFLLSKDGTFT